MYRYILILVFLFDITQAGVIGLAFNATKNKAIEKTKNTVVDIYKERKKVRREKESKIGNKSLLSKSEDKIDKTKEMAKNTVEKSVGKENIEYIKKERNQMKDILIGKPIN